MDQGQIMLCGVREPYLEALVVWAEGRFSSVITLESGTLPAVPAHGDFALCVIGVRGSVDDFSSDLGPLRKALPTCPVVVLAEEVPTDDVVRIVRCGVDDVIGLPALPGTVVDRVACHVAESHDTTPVGLLIGSGLAMQELKRDLLAVAPTHATVLITGETGVGKGLVARTIHEHSCWHDGPFVHVDCAALAPSVIESELFGHERGSFTGAAGPRAGRFEIAENGTIFLDEIADLPLQLQAKLLRVLQDREYERLGGERTRHTNARVIAATNSDLVAAIRNRSFRADLYFRLEVFHLSVPPLRNRMEDVPDLVRASLASLSLRLALPAPQITGSFLERLVGYHWPGNVRELHNVLERLLIKGRGALLDASAVDDTLAQRTREFLARADPAADSPRRAEFDTASERDEIAEVLVSVGGNVSRAARRLYMPRATLRRRIRDHGLSDLIPHD